jgi:hypothetical protein
VTASPTAPGADSVRRGHAGYERRRPGRPHKARPPVPAVLPDGQSLLRDIGHRPRTPPRLHHRPQLVQTRHQRDPRVRRATAARAGHGYPRRSGHGREPPRAAAFRSRKPPPLTFLAALTGKRPFNQPVRRMARCAYTGSGPSARSRLCCLHGSLPAGDGRPRHWLAARVPG